MARSDFGIRVTEAKTWTVASVSGEVDLATAPKIEALGDGGSKELALDLSGVKFIDSSGLRALVKLRELVPVLVIVSPSPVVRKLLALTNMLDMFDVRASVTELED